MTRDYKPATPKQKPAGKGSSFFTGLLIGLILGIGISVGVAIFVTGGESPFMAKQEETTQQAATEADGTKVTIEEAPASKEQPVATAPEKPRFDFYTILPGTESQVTEQEIQQSRAEQQVVSENYFLQVGAFQNEADADNMKAKLALLGMEAVVQTANVPDKGVWHRVRVGPFTEIDQISRVRTELTKNGFNADLIKIHSSIPDQ